MIILKSPHEIECIRKASKLTADTLSLLVEKAKPGITTLELDTIAEEYIRSHGGIPSCKGYYGFPATICASVNEEVVHGIPSAKRKLKNGDIVEIMTSKVSAPRLDWLNFVVTKQAASRIRQWYKKNKREDHIEIGKANLEHELTKTVFDEYVKNGEFDKVAKQMNYVSGDDLFAALGYGETTVNKIVNRLRKPPKQEGPANHKPRKASEKDIVGLEGLLYSFARCCSPIPGEPIVGVVTRSKGVTVHRLDCKTLENIPVERLIDIHWSGNNINKTYSTTIRIETAEKMGLLKDIIGVVSDNNTNINSANVKSKGKVGIIELGIELDNIYTLRKVMTALQSMPDVFSVKRIQTSYSHAPQQFTKKNNKPQKKRKKTSS